jgi:hypothetical protein
MRKILTLTIALVACGLIGVLLSSDASWARPKGGKTWLLCKCTCRYDDGKGNHYYGNSGGVWYTTSHDACDVFPSCQVRGPQGNLVAGFATGCLGHEESALKPGLKKAPSATITR